MNAWDHLPNAALIDRVIAHVKEYPEKWRVTWEASWEAARDAAWYVVRDAAWGAARDAARDAAREAAWGAAWYAARNAAWGAAREAAGDACCALIAWDDCGYLLDYTPAQVQALLTIDPTYHAARLLLPAVQAMKGGDA